MLIFVNQLDTLSTAALVFMDRHALEARNKNIDWTLIMGVHI